MGHHIFSCRRYQVILLIMQHLWVCWPYVALGTLLTRQHLLVGLQKRVKLNANACLC